MDYLSTKYGLVTDNDLVSENGQVFLVDLILLQDFVGKEIINSDVLEKTMEIQLESNLVKVGLYNRNTDLLDRTISHDNLLSIMSFTYSVNSQVRFEIWDYLLNHFGTYDNTKGKSSQLSRFLPFNPSNFFIWGLCVESYIYLLFFPIYLITMLLTINTAKENTGGKILTFIELYPHKEHWLVKHLYNLYVKTMVKQYGQDYTKELRQIYHGNNSKDFPINKLLGINQ